MTVSQVHQRLDRELKALVRELWPAFTQVLRERAVSATLELPDIEDTLQYFQAYSNSIPSAIPSIQLAVAELDERNGIFAAPGQPLHKQLLKKVAGPAALRIFERVEWI
jgi:hypothetical protein